MQISDLHKDLKKYLRKHGLENKFKKQLKLFFNNPKHPSLNVELLEPKDRKIYSFRIDRKYRAIFVVVKSKVIIIDINDHYK